MKRIGGLFDEIISIENLQLADEKARRGKRKSKDILSHDENCEQNIIDLHLALKNKTFSTSKYNIFVIQEKKERVISSLPYIDRIVHHAIIQVLEPVFTKIFIANTYSCIKGRGIHGAATAVKKALKDVDNTTYCLKLDIKQFYPSINHDVLKTIIRRKIKDKDLLWLLDDIIDSTNGVPIGNYTSQYFANLYLTYFDHWLKEVKKVKYYFRYADDMVILHGSKEYLHQLLAEIREYIENQLQLTIKDNYQISPVESRGIDFVGYVVIHYCAKVLKRASLR